MNWLEAFNWSEEGLEDIRFIAYSYIKQGNYNLAITFFEALNILSPDNPYDLQTLGALYLQQNDNLQAIKYLNRALKLEPTHLPSLLNRAKALFSLGNNKEGIREARKLAYCKDKEIADQAKALLMTYI